MRRSLTCRVNYLIKQDQAYFAPVPASWRAPPVTVHVRRIKIAQARAVDQGAGSPGGQEPEVVPPEGGPWAGLTNCNEASPACSRSPLEPPHLGWSHLDGPAGRQLVLDPHLYATAAPIQVRHASSDASRFYALPVGVRDILGKQLMEPAIAHSRDFLITARPPRIDHP
jgi:hypothetical protein